MKNFVMLSGIPRSGSQLLSSILNQHPKIYSTTTSPIADLIIDVSNKWNEISQNIVNPHPQQLRNILFAILNGAYQHIEKPFIVDKNRLWPRYGRLLSTTLKDKPKIICTVRDIPDVLASYILLIEKNKDKLSFIDQHLINENLLINNKNRCKILWEVYINHPYKSLMIGVNEKKADLLFCSYNEIVNDTQNTINRICQFIGIENFTVDKNNLQPMDENDQYHGGLEGLHYVRPQLSKTSPSPEKILGKEIVDYYRNMHLEFWKKYER